MTSLPAFVGWLNVCHICSCTDGQTVSYELRPLMTFSFLCNECPIKYSSSGDYQLWELWSLTVLFLCLELLFFALLKAAVSGSLYNIWTPNSRWRLFLKPQKPEPLRVFEIRSPSSWKKVFLFLCMVDSSPSCSISIQAGWVQWTYRRPLPQRDKSYKYIS